MSKSSATTFTIYDVNLEDFEERVIAASSATPIMVDFWADWCAPCHAIAPVLERVVRESDGAIGLARVEVDAGENMKLAGKYQTRGFPTVILFHEGTEIDRFSGAQPLHFIEDFLSRNLGLL